MELRIVQGVIGLVVLGALVIFTAFPQVKPDWIQIGSGRGPRTTNASFHRELACDPNSAEACLERGAEYFLDEKWEKAVKELTAAINKDPQNADAYFMRGAAWENLDEFAKAVSDFDTVVRLTPKDPEAYFARAECQDELGNAAAALADLETVLRLDRNNNDALRLRGKLREEARDYKGALADYQEAARLVPDDAWTLDNLAWVLATAPDARLRDGQKSLKTARQAVKLDGGKVWNSLDTLAAAYAEMGMFAEAERSEKDAIKLAPQDERPELQSRLELYRAKQRYRLPQ